MDVYKYADLLSVWWFELKKIRVGCSCRKDLHLRPTSLSSTDLGFFPCNVNWEEYSV